MEQLESRRLLSINFTRQLVAPVGRSRVYSVDVGDIDGDGDLDVAAAVRGGAGGLTRILWYQNADGRGGFGSERVIHEMDQVPVSLRLADFDGDGDIDIATSQERNGLAWHENLNGRGTFGLRRRLAGDTPFRFHVADINGNGQPGILAVGRGFVDWHPNNGGLGEYPERIVSDANASGGGFMIAVGDIDGDGDQDIAVIERRGVDKWLENIDGGAEFREHLIPNEHNTKDGVALADFDGNGTLDALLGLHHDEGFP